MDKVNYKPRFKLKSKNPLPLSEIVAKMRPEDAPFIKKQLERSLYEYYRRFGIQPFSLQYNSILRDYVLVADSTIGLVDCTFFEIEIEPKIPGLSIGKCLQMAHRCQFSSLVHHSNTIIEEQLSDALHLEGVEYFAIAYLSAINDVITEGLLRISSSFDGPDPDLRGTLLPVEHVARGGFPLEPYTRRTTETLNLPVNRTLKTALQKCQRYSRNEKIQRLATNALTSFTEVQNKASTEEPIYEFESSLPREDYKRAINLAQLILQGFDPLRGEDSSFLPYYVINLDELFERFIAYELKRLIKRDSYQVHLQKGYEHPTDPKLLNKEIKPDIVVEPTEQSNRIVLDTKNKYSSINTDSFPDVANNDLYQITYYAISLNAKGVLLVYPASGENWTKYPLKSSESEEAYQKKRLKRTAEIHKDLKSSFKVIISQNQEVTIYLWRVKLDGTMEETRKSIAELAHFILDLLRGEI